MTSLQFLLAQLCALELAFVFSSLLVFVHRLRCLLQPTSFYLKIRCKDPHILRELLLSRVYALSVFLQERTQLSKVKLASAGIAKRECEPLVTILSSRETLPGFSVGLGWVQVTHTSTIIVHIFLHVNV